MRAPAVSFAKRFAAALMAALLTFALLPASAFAEGEGDLAGVEGSEGAFGSEVPTSPQPPSNPSTDASNSTVTASSSEAGTLATSLMGRPASFVNADVLLNSEPIIGSFTVDGLTFAVTEGSDVELVGAARAEGAFGSEVPTSPQPPSASTTEAEGPALLIPESVTYDDVEYSVTSIGAYAFYLSGVTSVELPASIVEVDDRAFRSSDVASVEVAEGNTSYSSFDGALYDADQSSLLLIPEGKQGTVLLPKTAESAAPSVFSHCPLVTQVSVEEGSAAFASENGLLYDASLETLLRVPAGATDITIREGCTTIAAGAMEACASLATINAPASVTSISPDVFTSVPTVNLPAAALAEDAPQLTAMVALSSADDDLPDIDSTSIQVLLKEDANASLWEHAFAQVAHIEDGSIGIIEATTVEAATYSAIAFNTTCRTGGYIASHSYSESAGIGERYAHASTSASSVTGKISGTNCSFRAVGIPTGYTITVAPYAGYHFTGWNFDNSNNAAFTSRSWTLTSSVELYAVFSANSYTMTLQDGDSSRKVGVIYANALPVISAPQKPGYIFGGYYSQPNGQGTRYYSSAQEGATGVRNWDIANNATLYAYWIMGDHDLGFDTSSEPNDEEYLGEPIDDKTVTGDQITSGEKVEVEDPKRPGYVFQGWTIPNAEGTEAIDQKLVYKDETDGKWYVDASKLPDYAGDDGRVELTARWTSVISVDVPSAATFYYDLVTDQSSEAHEAALSGTTSFSSQSQVDLRVCGLESVKASGADALFSSGADSALLSVYPAADGSATTVEDAQGPAEEKPSTAVDFALDDIVLEAAFAKAGADAFSIPAGDDLTLSYRLNLGDGASLDYDKVLSMAEGDEASLASISYCFAANYDSPADWGEPLWIENPDTSEGAPRFLVLDDIKAAAEDLSAKGEASPYFAAYDTLMRAVTSEMVTDPAYDANSQRFFQMRVGNSYVPVQVIGICDDVTTDGKKAGLTFQLKNACRATGPFYPNTNSTTYGWYDGVHPNLIREWLRGDYWDILPSAMQAAIVEVVKYQQIYEEGGTNTLPATAKGLQGPTIDTLFLPSNYEIFGDVFLKPGGGSDTVLFDRYGSEALTSVAGYTPTRYDWYATKQRIGELTLDDISRTYQGELRSWWTRSAHRTGAAKNAFLSVYYGTATANYGSSNAGYGVVPCFAL